ncbi:hypothetical protein LAZ67_2001116 [Cordylochernes scorpioides]|uniref:RRM domain-containing protein n=1 Tax=Cordylochernes scorpioides TaxID=51811 RepID=A0ABY6K185_9ARAC|nr:hypothetical protein LAZ67_2001116 [Cordylochernes scorpioides]
MNNNRQVPPKRSNNNGRKGRKRREVDITTQINMIFPDMRINEGTKQRQQKPNNKTIENKPKNTNVDKRSEENRSNEPRQAFRNSEKVEKKPSPRKETLDIFSIYMGNIPYTTTTEQIESLFRRCGHIKNITIVKDPSGKPKGYAFIEFMGHYEATNAINTMNGIEFGGRRIVVKVKTVPYHPFSRPLGLASVSAMSSFEQRANIKFCVNFKKSFTETLALISEAYED